MESEKLFHNAHSGKLENTSVLEARSQANWLESRPGPVAQDHQSDGKWQRLFCPKTPLRVSATGVAEHFSLLR